MEPLQFVAPNLCGFDPGLEAGSRIKMNHYIQPSNLSSALLYLKLEISPFHLNSEEMEDIFKRTRSSFSGIFAYFIIIFYYRALKQKSDKLIGLF